MAEASKPTVLLRHELPDGTAHFDWLLGSDEAGEQPLISFRLAARVDELAPGRALAAERIADHRAAYLDYEGEISGGRGRVTRIARGRIDVSRETDQHWDLRLTWSEREGGRRIQHLRVVHERESRWRVISLPAPP